MFCVPAVGASVDSGLGESVTKVDTIADTNLKTSADSENALNNINQAMKQLRTFNNKLSNLHAEFEASLTKFGSIYQQPRENSTSSFGNTIDRTTASQFANFSEKLMQQSIDNAIQTQANASPSTVLFFYAELTNSFHILVNHNQFFINPKSF